ncbi:MAG: hypothetical protein RL492_1819 [Verrucomicrobiota bacterium]|jgi:hypothetical protein
MDHDPLSPTDWRTRLTRRSFLNASVQGIGAVALSSLLSRDLLAAANPAAKGGLPTLPHFAPKAKRMICLWQGGGPSHIDLFDPKPKMVDFAGKDIPASVRGDTRLSTMSSGYSKWPCVPAIKPFKKYGASGIEMSTMLPHIGSIADELCVVRSMNTEAVNHAPGVTFFMTGSQIPGRPAMGAWLAYGLGTMNEDLPAFVVMTSSDKTKTCGQLFFEHYWSNGFLPGKHQGVRFRGTGDPVPYVGNPAGVSRDARRAMLDDVQAFNREHLGVVGDPEIDTRISQYEMAFRMQASVPDLLDFRNEPKAVLDMYGPDVLTPGTFANNCLIARRLAERGVRFTQLMHAGWDQHNNLTTGQLGVQCQDTDQPSAALVKDLKQRGLLDDTLVVWGGEFGRTPFGQNQQGQGYKGRDHFGKAYSWWLAGGGIKKGHVYGETDEFGWNITKDSMHVHDMQATLMHLFGINHEALTFRYQGRQFRLTDVHGKVAKGVLA